MSDCCGNPGVGMPPTGLANLEYKSFNPGEVRLYGRPAVMYKKTAGPPMSSEELEKNIENEIKKFELRPESSKDLIEIIKRLIEAQMRGAGIVGDNITFAVFDGEAYHYLSVDTNMPTKYLNSIGVIYGYAYEGHCYKLPKPQIMFLPAQAKNLKSDKCGCDCGYTPELGYAVWSIDKLRRAIALDVRSDDLKTLVLEENLPGNRSPLAYAQTMALAPQRHRD